MIDPAMCRPGRLDKLLYVDLPTADERAEIVRTMTRKVPLGPPGDADATASALVRLEALVRERCDGYSGADLAALVREAGVVALKRNLGALDVLEAEGQATVGQMASILVGLDDFAHALEKVTPSVSAAQRRRYEALRSKFAGLPVRGGREEDDKRVDGKAMSS